jgi:hypothetical protein
MFNGSMSSDRIGFWRWTVACGLAEFLGIAIAALWWALADRLEPEPGSLSAQLSMLALKGASGLLEGAILGFAQASVLRRLYPALSRRFWVTATMVLAFVGWVVGSAPSILLAGSGADSTGSFQPSMGQIILYAALFGLLAGAAFGAAQWLALRRAARRAALWIPANMTGWMVALPVVYIAASAGSGQAGLAEIALRGLGGGLGAGLILGALIYPFLSWMPPVQRYAPPR